MFNNAGIAIGGYFEDVPFEKTLDMIDINLMGVLNGFYAAIPYLSLRKHLLFGSDLRSGRNGYVYGDKIRNQGIYSCHEC